MTLIGIPDGWPDTDPASIIAATQPATTAPDGFDPTDLDHFDDAPICGARLGLTTDDDGHMTAVCGEDEGHYPDSPHQAGLSWVEPGDIPLPPEPSCPRCADTGTDSSGDRCTCPAGDLPTDKTTPDPERARP